MVKWKNSYVVVLIVFFFVFIFSAIGSAQHVKDAVGIESIRCECCGGIVVLQESIVVNETFEEETTPTKSGVSNISYCIYCKVDRTFNEYYYYYRVYEAVYKWHECIDCGWCSAGWTEPGDLIEETRCSYDMCNVCGWKTWLY